MFLTIGWKNNHLISLCHFSDGSLYITTPVDPVFLILPYLIQAAKVRSWLITTVKNINNNAINNYTIKI
jgi:hypothetical protein